MKVNKIICLLLIAVLIFSFTGCGTQVISVNVENNDQLHNTTLGEDALVLIGNGLWYDTSTRIVYIKMVVMGGYSYFSAYYAPNGLPYRYNPDTNTFEEIER